MVSRRSVRLVFQTALLVALVTGLRSSADGQDNFSLKASPGTGVPQLIFYHGMVLDENLQEIPPTLDNVSFVLRRFAEGLAAHSSDAANARIVDMLRNAPAPEMDKNDELLRSAALARWLLQNNDYPQEDSLDPMLRALERWATIPTQEGINVQLRNNSRLAPMLAAMELEIQDEEIKDEPQPATTDYIKECMSAQVPIPPDWGDARWKFQDRLDPNFSFVQDSPNSVAQVWTYTDPNVPGLCVGLPRILNATQGIGLFGIICQSDTTGKACFWDNVDRITGKQLTSEESKHLKIAAVQDGSMLGENCTNCHRGENVFVIHPRTAVDLSEVFNTKPEVPWYSPISGQATWGNPGPIEGLTECKGCHKVPELAENNNDTSTHLGRESAYCRILRQVADKTMPPTGSPAGWRNPTSHQADVNMLRTKCEQLK